jgi:hypothetical protein
VVTTSIASSLNYIGFQADFTFDSAVVSFDTGSSGPVEAGGLTASNWNLSDIVLNSGPGTIKTVRVSAFSADGVTPLSGSGMLFVVRFTVSGTTGASPLLWQADQNSFVFIDTNLNTFAPTQENGLVTIVSATPTPCSCGGLNISGTVTNCSSAVPAPNVTFTLVGTFGGSTSSDQAGNYTFSSIPSGMGSYGVTPSKAARTPGSAGINTLDVVAVQRHFLGVSLLTGCRLTAADVNNSGGINTLDVILIQRFFLGLSGAANVGKYQFNPPNRSYPAANVTFTSQDYTALVFGDVAGPFVP